MLTHHLHGECWYQIVLQKTLRDATRVSCLCPLTNTACTAWISEVMRKADRYEKHWQILSTMEGPWGQPYPCVSVPSELSINRTFNASELYGVWNTRVTGNGWNEYGYPINTAGQGYQEQNKLYEYTWYIPSYHVIPSPIQDPFTTERTKQHRYILKLYGRINIHTYWDV